MKKRALITGITGQDGAYLTKLLADKGYDVYGAHRRTSRLSTERLDELGIADAVTYVPIELLEFTNILRTLERVQPDEVYNLAAQSFVATSFEQPIFTADVTAIGALRMLEALRTVRPTARFYQASSSEMFGMATECPQTERTRFHPRSPYALSKLFAHWATVNYRESYGMFACSGILFNHESPLRGPEFVTRKISDAVARIARGRQDKLVLGNLDASRDWGYAAEYVQAMWLMLQRDQPDDYVVGTGESHTIREFVELAFRCVNIEIAWDGEGPHTRGRDARTGRELVVVSAEFYRPAEVDRLEADASRATEHLGWRPKTRFPELVALMVNADLARIDRPQTAGATT